MLGVANIVSLKYAPLQLPQNLHNFSEGYLKHLTNFKGGGEVIVEEHLAIFLNFVESVNLGAKYVYTKLFVQSLKGEVGKWFRKLDANTIPLWEVF